MICLALLLALLIGGSSPAAALTKYCSSDKCCSYCDYYDNNGNWVGSIYWCWHGCNPV
ncbi:MAG TPA: hypothetical protein VHR45_07785 [Thermoanaerobaculia bacterium]|nr:hypothetical protein [Thermoanaerobaculia bacterium]